MKTLLSKGRKRITTELEGEKINLQELSLAEIESLKAEKNEVQLSLRLIVASVVDENGAKVYAESDIEPLRAAIGPNALSVLGAAIVKLNGFDKKKASADPKASAMTSDSDSASASSSASPTPTSSPTP